MKWGMVGYGMHRNGVEWNGIILYIYIFARNLYADKFVFLESMKYCDNSNNSNNSNNNETQNRNHEVQ